MKKITKIENKIEIKLKTKVAAYCRVSTDSEDQLLSLEAQKEHYKDLIKNNPEWTFAGLYYDEGITGTKKEKRPALQRMLEDCAKGKIDLIITKSISRFARNTTDCLSIVRDLAYMGIFIFFEKENINTRDMEGEFILSVLSSLAAEESVSISQNVKWSVQKQFQSGEYVISRPPLGYKNVNKKLEVIPKEAEIVKEIFNDYLSGMSAAAIAIKLREKGIHTKRGGLWRSNTITAILKNEKYTGEVIFQKTWTDDGFTRHKNYGEQDQYCIENHHEPIVSREDYIKVQELLERHFSEKGGVKGSDKYNKRYAFSGKIICGECGGPMHRKIRKQNGSSYIEWACIKHIENKGLCHMKAIRQDYIEATIVTMMNKLYFASDSMLATLLDDLKKEDQSNGFKSIDELEQKIDSLTEQRENLSDLLAQGILDAEIYNEENNELLSKIDQMGDMLQDMKTKAGDNLKKATAVEKLIHYLNKHENMNEYDEDMFTEFISRIIVHTRSSVELELKCGLHLREELINTNKYGEHAPLASSKKYCLFRIGRKIKDPLKKAEFTYSKIVEVENGTDKKHNHYSGS